MATITPFRITPCHAALGAVVDDIDLSEPLDGATVAALRAALARHEVLFFPGQSLTPEQQVRFGSSFGVLERHDALPAFADLPEVVVFDTDAGTATAEWWHADVTCASQPPMGAVLQMVIAPEQGGATHWASMTAAYDALDDDVKRRLDGLTALHRSWWRPVQECVHPVVRVHPETGRRTLFVNGIFTKQILGLPDSDAGELLQFLVGHAIRDEFTVCHRWKAGDIAFWDNRSTQHRVDNDFGDARRRGHRIAIEGDTPR